MLQWQALLFSWLIEIPIVLVILNQADVTHVRSIIAAILATGLTHPFAWSLAQGLPASDYTCNVFMIELAVICIEVVTLKILTRASWGAVLFAAVVANAGSYLLGCFL